MSISYTRQPDGSYAKSGEPPSTRNVRIQVLGRKPFGSYSLSEATEVIEQAISKGQVTHDEYRILPGEETPMDEAAKVRLRAAAKIRKEKREAEKQALEADEHRAAEELQQ